MHHYVRPDGLPPVNGFSHAVAFTGPMVLIGPGPGPSGRSATSTSPAAGPPASSLVQVKSLVNPQFRIEIEALAAT
jgi:hypothetical protein